MSFLHKAVVAMTASFLLPIFVPGFFGWLNGLIAVPMALLLFWQKEHDNKWLVYAILVSAVVSYSYDQLELFLFELAFLPLAYTIFYCHKRGIDIIKTCSYSFVVLIITWSLFWFMVFPGSESNPHSQLTELTNQVVKQTYEVYQTNKEIPADVKANLDKVLKTMEEVLPKLIPSFLVCIAIITVWMNLLVYNTIVRRLEREEHVPWPPYKHWAIPDKLIWLPLIGIGLTFLSDNLLYLGLNLIIISALIYFLQGLAVVIYLFDRWNVPLFLRVLFYLLLIFQSYGVIFISLLGFMDVWFEFRKKS